MGGGVGGRGRGRGREEGRGSDGGFMRCERIVGDDM